VLGGGSNLLVSDAGFRDWYCNMTIGGIDTGDEDWETDLTPRSWGRVGDTGGARGGGQLRGSGVPERIPGTVCATPVQNVGAYGQDVSETIVRVCGIDAGDVGAGGVRPAACGFSYRQSRFNGRDRGATS